MEARKEQKARKAEERRRGRLTYLKQSHPTASLSIIHHPSSRPDHNILILSWHECAQGWNMSYWIIFGLLETKSKAAGSFNKTHIKLVLRRSICAKSELMLFQSYVTSSRLHECALPILLLMRLVSDHNRISKQISKNGTWMCGVPLKKRKSTQ